MMNSKPPTICDAINSLAPGALWIISENDFETINWVSEDIKKPTKSEIDAEMKRLQHEFAQTEYQRKRATEYPDFREYLDGLVKGDSAQVESYFDKCLAVKAKYPKPGE